ncbi:MAG: hypothetical protein ACR2NX_15640 [Chthoniobacterales bacterium]
MGAATAAAVARVLDSMNGRVARLAVGIFLLFLGAARSSWAEQPYEVTKVELRLPGGTVEA